MWWLATSILCNWVQLGYLDRLSGEPYRREYETALRVDQSNYEAGRLWASNLLAAGVKVPRWTSSRRLPRSMGLALAEAQRAVGSWVVPISESYRVIVLRSPSR